MVFPQQQRRSLVCGATGAGVGWGGVAPAGALLRASRHRPCTGMSLRFLFLSPPPVFLKEQLASFVVAFSSRFYPRFHNNFLPLLVGCGCCRMNTSSCFYAGCTRRPGSTKYHRPCRGHIKKRRCAAHSTSAQQRSVRHTAPARRVQLDAQRSMRERASAVSEQSSTYHHHDSACCHQPHWSRAFRCSIRLGTRRRGGDTSSAPLATCAFFRRRGAPPPPPPGPPPISIIHRTSRRAMMPLRTRPAAIPPRDRPRSARRRRCARASS